MFCSQCGKEMPDSAKFCANCGTQTGSAQTPASASLDTGEPLLILKPQFIGAVTALSVLPLQLFMTVWGAGFCGGFSMFAVKALKLPVPGWFPFVFFGLVFFFGIPLLAYTSKKKTYARTEYRLFRDRVEYTEGFWTAEEKTLRYDRVTETSMRRSIFQKKQNLGTIHLATPTVSMSQGRPMNGVLIRDIKDPEKVYEVIQKIIGK